MRFFSFQRSDPPIPKLTDAEEPSKESLIEDVAEGICRRGMGGPAIFLLESVKPLNFIGSQVAHALTPMASLLVDWKKWESLAEALEERDTLERLISKIEEKERPSSPRN
ncbi:MAG: hypothetical protein V2A74_12285 [bacterium]